MKCPLVCLLILAGLAGCSKPTAVGKYYFDASNPSLLPGADKMILDVKADGNVEFGAGAFTLLKATWKEEGDVVTFSVGQGLITTVYKNTGTALVPQKDGKDDTSWKFTKK